MASEGAGVVGYGQWRTVLHYPGCLINIERDNFQGDSLTSLLVCLVLNLLSTLLEGSGLAYRLQKGDRVISHLL